MTELAERGLLDTTTICWMGEFGRTPNINNNAGRDHFPDAWSCVLAGGGIAGGQAYGKTNESGMEVTEGKTEVQDLLATLCHAVGVDPETEQLLAAESSHQNFRRHLDRSGSQLTCSALGSLIASCR